MDDRDRLDEREEKTEEHEDKPNPDDRLDERVEQLGPPPKRRVVDEEDVPPKAA